MSIDYSEIKIPHRSDKDIRTVADEFRNKYWDDSIPVDIELIAERGLGLYLTPVPGIKIITSTDAILLGNLKEIVIDDNVIDVRIRFSIAHEIGHYVLHSKEIASLRQKSFEDWKDTLRNMPGAMWGRAEYQANEFAGRLLIPKEKLIDSLEKLKPQIREAKKIINEDVSALNQFIAPIIAKNFNVADQVIRIRLEKEGINPFSILNS